MTPDEFRDGRNVGHTEANLEGLARGIDRLESQSDRILDTQARQGERITRLETAFTIAQWVAGILAAGCTAAVGWILHKIHTGG